LLGAPEALAVSHLVEVDMKLVECQNCLTTVLPSQNGMFPACGQEGNTGERLAGSREI
jgi:hypothetical protein